MRTDSLSVISVILATKNEERNILRCLESIRQQTYPSDKIEVVVVDNNSTDKTQEIAKKKVEKILNLPEIISLNGISNYRGAQLNIGVKMCKGDIVFFPDADMTFDKNLLYEANDLIQMKQMDALYIPEIVIGKGLFGKIRNFERSFYNMTCIDALRVIRKKTFLQIGGFDSANIKFGPDDWDFTKKVKQSTNKITITSANIYHHEVDLDLLKYIVKKNNYVHTFRGYTEKWGSNDPDIKKQLGIKYRFFGVFIEQNKWKKLIKYPALSVGMFGIRILVGIMYLLKKFVR